MGGIVRAFTLYRSCTGINNKIDAARLPFDAEGGVTSLESGVDVLIDQSGGLSARRGTTTVLSGSYHSGFPVSGSAFLAVKDRTADSAIYLMTPQANGGLVEEGVVSGLAKGAPVEFRKVDERVYYMNGFQLGYIEDGAAYAWPVNQWPRDTTAQFVPTPAGEHFDVISSTFVLIKGKEIIYTEPGLWGLVDNTRNYRRLESPGLMVASVDTGLYVSDSETVYFLPGRNPAEWVPKKVLDYPAKPYCKHHKLVDPSHFGLQTSDPSVLFGTVRGPVLGLPDGSVFNLIDKQVAMTDTGIRGAIMVVDETTILLSGV